MNGTRVKALKDFTSNEISIAKDDVGAIVSYPGRDDGQAENQPNVDLGVIRVAFDQGEGTIGIVCVQIDKMADFFVTVPVNTPITSPS